MKFYNTNSNCIKISISRIIRHLNQPRCLLSGLSEVFCLLVTNARVYVSYVHKKFCHIVARYHPSTDSYYYCYIILYITRMDSVESLKSMILDFGVGESNVGDVKRRN